MRLSGEEELETSSCLHPFYSCGDNGNIWQVAVATNTTFAYNPEGNQWRWSASTSSCNSAVAATSHVRVLIWNRSWGTFVPLIVRQVPCHIYCACSHNFLIHAQSNLALIFSCILTNKHWQYLSEGLLTDHRYLSAAGLLSESSLHAWTGLWQLGRLNYL